MDAVQIELDRVQSEIDELGFALYGISEKTVARSLKDLVLARTMTALTLLAATAMVTTWRTIVVR